MYITHICDECRGQQFVESHGELTINCGLVKESFTVDATGIYGEIGDNQLDHGFKKLTKTYIDTLKQLPFLDVFNCSMNYMFCLGIMVHYVRFMFQCILEEV